MTTPALAARAAEISLNALRLPRSKRGLHAAVEALEARIAPATFTWDGGGDGSKWSDGLNWVGDVAPGAGSDLVFAGPGVVTNNDFAAGTHFASLALSGSGFALNGNAIALDGNLTASHPTGTDSVGLDITLAVSRNFVNTNAGATLNFSGQLSAVGTLTFDGAGMTNVTGAITGATAALTKTGSGNLVLTGDNSYTGTTTVSALGGKLSIRGGGDIAQSSLITVNTGGILEVDNSLTAGVNRIGDFVPVSLLGGELIHIGNSSTTVSEKVGILSTTPVAASEGGGPSVVRSVWNGADVELVGTNLGRAAGGTMKFVAEGADLGTAANHVRFTVSIANVVNNTIGWATLDQPGTSGLEFVTHDPANGISAAPFKTSLAAAGPTDNVKLSASEAFTGSKTVNALMLTGSGVAVSGGTSLHVASGLIYSAGSSNAVTTPVRFSGVDAIYEVETGASLTLSGSQIAALTEVQAVTAGAGVTSFTLAFPAIGGVGAAGTTAAIVKATADGAAIQTALQSIPALAGNVAVTGAAGGPYTVNFINALAGLDVPALTAATTVTGAGDTTVGILETTRGGAISPLVSEQQTLTVGANVSSLTFGYNGANAAALAYSASLSAAAVQTQLSSIAALNGNVSVGGPNGGPYVVTFTGALASRDVPPLNVTPTGSGSAIFNETAKGGLGVGAALGITARKELVGTLLLDADNTDFTGAFGIGEGAVTLKHSNALGHLDAFQNLSLGGTISGNFTLTFNGRTTASMSGSATTAATLQSALESLPTIGPGNVRVEQFATTGFRIIFQGALADQPVSAITSNTTGGISASMANVRAGQSGATVVHAGAALLLGDNLAIGNESLTLNGSGQSNTGALRSVAGTSTWGVTLPSTLVPTSTAITLGSTSFVGVDAGQLTLEAAIVGAAGVTKTGAGTLEYRGVQANTYTGTTTVLEGQLNLNKRANVADSAMGGGLTIGDDLGGANADRVVLMAPDQIANLTSLVTVKSSGQLITNLGAASETQTITYGATGGTFTLTFAGRTTTGLAFNASPAAVQAALESLASIGAGNVAVGGTPGAYTVSFQSALANANLPQMVAASLLTNAGSAATISTATTTHGVGNEVQAINLSSGGLSGSYTVRIAGSIASNNVTISASGAAANLQNALAAQSNIGAGSVLVLGPDSSTGGGTFYVIFRGTLAGANVPLITVASGTLANGGAQYPAPGVTAATLSEAAGNEVQSITLGGTGLGGTYNVLFGGLISGIISPSDSAATVQGVLEAMSSIGVGNVRVLSGLAGTGASYQVIFTGFFTKTDLAQLDVISSLTGTTPTVTSATVRDGGTESVGGITLIGGNISLPGGTSLSTNGITFQGGSVGGPGTFNLRGNLTSSTDSPGSIDAPLNLQGGSRTFTVNDGASVRDLSIGGVISNGQLTKSGAGALVLANAGNTFSGFTLNQGSLFVGADASGTVAGTNTALGVGVLVAAGGTIVADGADRIIARPVQISGNLTLGGTVAVGGTFGLTFNNTFAMSGNTTLNVADALMSATMATGVSEFSAGLSLTKAGAGRVTLTTGNSYSGGTSITGGTLALTNTAGSATGSGAIQIATGGTLAGNGKASGAATVAAGGAIAPGPGGPLSIGALTSAGEFKAQVNGTGAGQFDQLKVTGAVDLTGSSLNLSGSIGLGSGVVVLIDNDGTGDAVTGAFTGHAEGSLVTVNGHDFLLTYTGGDGNDVALVSTVAVSISATDSDVAEPANHGQFRVQLTQTNTVDTVISYNVTGSTATSGADYQALSGSVTILAGALFAPIDLTVLNDSIVEGDETVQINLTGITSGSTANLAVVLNPNQSTSSVTIKDNDSATLQFTTATSAIGEAGGTLNLGVQLLITADGVPGTGTLGQAVSVNVQDFIGTAAAGSDFTFTSPTTLTFAAGSSGATQQVTLAITDDVRVEGTETKAFLLSDLGDSTGQVSFGGAAIHTVTITDNDTATLQFDSATSTAGEGAGTLNVGVRLIVTANGVADSGVLGRDVTVNVHDLLTGSAMAGGTDYTFADPVTLTFADGQAGIVRNVSLTLNNDAAVENTETVKLALDTLADPSGQVTLGLAAHTGSITDNDGATVTLTGGGTLAEGNSGQAVYTFTATLDHAVQGGFSVAYATSDGSAKTADLDYTAQSGTLTFVGIAGETQTFTVNALGDTKFENDEAFTAALGMLTGAPAGVSVNGSAVTATITNDDTKPVITISDVSASEAGPNGAIPLASFLVSLSNASFQPVTVDYTTLDATAIAPGDYTAVKGTLTFDPGVTTQLITVLLRPDTLFEGGNETFTVNLSIAKGGTLGDSQAIGTIVTDDGTPDNIFTLNAKTPFTFFDHNHDKVTVKLSGLGTGTLILDGGVPDGADISEINLDGNAAKSTLSIAVVKDRTMGDGLVKLGEVTVNGGLTAFTGVGVDLTTGGLRATGTVKTITAHSLLAGEIFTGGVAADKLALTVVGALGTGDPILIKTPETISALKAGSIGAGEIHAEGLGSITVTAGGLAADITSSLAIGRISVKGGAVSGDLVAKNFGAISITGGGLSGSLTSQTPPVTLGTTKALTSLSVTGGNLSGDLHLAGTSGAITVKTGSLSGHLTASSFGAVSVSGGGFSGTISSLASAATLGRNKALTSLSVTGGDLAGNVNAVGATGAITVKTGALLGNLTAASFGAVSVTGGVFGGTLLSTTPLAMLGTTKALASLSVTTGNLSGLVRVTGASGAITVKGGGMSGELGAASFGAVSVTGGDFSGTLISLTPAATLGRTKALTSLTVTDGNLTGDVRLLGASGAITVRARPALAAGDLNGASIVASAIASLTVGRDVISSVILAGADLGADYLLGGDDDTFAAGTIGAIKIGRNVSGAGSLLGAGFSSTDAVLKDANDAIIDGVASFIQSLTITSQALPESYFAAGLFKTAPKIAGAVVATVGDGRFKVG